MHVGIYTNSLMFSEIPLEMYICTLLYIYVYLMTFYTCIISYIYRFQYNLHLYLIIQINNNIFYLLYIIYI